MSAEDAAAILVKTGLTHAEQLQILMNHGLSESEAEAALATAAKSATDVTATATTSGLTVATTSLKAALNGLKTALMSNPFVLIIAGAVAAIAAFKTFYDSADKAAEKARELANTSISNADEEKTKQEKLDELIEKYEKLKSKQVQDADTRAKILQVQTDINKLVGTQAEGLDLVNGRLDTELEKLRQIAQINLESSIPTFEKAYIDAANATEKTTFDNNSSWVRDFGIFKKQHDAETIVVDANLELKSALERIYSDTNNSIIKSYIDELEKGSLGETHLALAKQIVETMDGIAEEDRDAVLTAIEAIKSGKGSYEITVSDITNELENFAEMNQAEQLAAVRSALEYMEGIEGFDYQKDSLWQQLVEVEKALSGSDGAFTKQVQAASSLLEALTKKEIGAGEELDSIDEYFAYKQNIIDSVLGNNVIQQAIDDGALTVEGIESYIDTYLGTLDKYSDFYENSKSDIEPDVKISFADLIADDDENAFSAKVDNYVNKVQILQSALEKFNSGELDAADMVDLFKEFPELAKNSDNLGGAITDLIKDLTGYNSVVDDTGKVTSEATGIMAVFEDAFGRVESDEDVAALEAFMDAVLELGEVVGSTEFSIDIDAETNGMENLWTAMKESVSSTGLTAESISNLKARYQDLDNYNAAALFEKTANGIHLNTAALRELESEYEKQKKNNINDSLNDLISQYNDLTEQINNADDAASSADLYAQRSKILDQINDTAELAAMYEGLTSAFYKWEQAQSIGEEGDMYDSLAGSLEDIKQLYDDGLIGTNKFRTAVQLMSNEDLSTASVDELLSAYESGYGVMTRYFQDGSDGCLNFLSDVQKLNSEWAHMNEDGSWEINFGVGNDQEIADALGINVESVQAIMRKLSDYGFDINLDSVFSQLDLLEARAEQANQALIEIGATDITFNFETDSIDFLDEQIQQAKDLLDSLYDDDGELNVNYNEGDVENAIAIIERLIYRKQSLDDAAILKVDTSNANTDIETIISKLQDFKASYNNLEVQTAIGADTTEAQSTCNGLLEEISGMDAEILATLGVDTTNLDTLNESINSITPEVMVTCGLDASLIEDYQAAEHTAEGTVIWDNNISKVTSWIGQSHTATGTVNWGNNTTNVKTHFTATGTVNWSNAGKAQGTAFARGNWGAKESGVALGGEVGQELVVRNGKFFTIGADSAEFFAYKKGDIIFNAEQTRQILANGKITNGKKRGVSYAEGTAFSSGTGKITGSGKVKTTPSGSTGNNSSNKSNNSSNNSSTKEDEPEVIDWIEIAIDRIERAINKLKTTAESTYKSLKTKLGATADEITKVSEEIDLQGKAYNRYMEQANSVGLSPELAAKVQAGTIDISEYDSDTADLINKYKEWYEKALDCSDAIDTLHETLASLYEDNFNNIQTDFENQLSLLEHLTNTYNTGISALEAKGYLQSTQYYAALQDVEKQNIGVMEKELQDLTTAFSEAMASGEIEEGSEAWYEMQKSINGVKESIADANVQLLEYAKTMREIEWSFFDYTQDRIGQITQESDFLINLMSNKKLYGDKGQFTNYGLATAGLHAQNYNVYMAQADKYAEEIKKIDKEIANDPYNTDLIARREELLGLQQQSILAAEDEKQAIVDMVKEGIQLELDALKELIDTYKDSLDSAKDLYEYQKKIKEKTSEIASLQKQLSAYENDVSEETRAKVQQLKVDLSEAEEDLAEIEYERFISDTKSMLDELYIEYEQVLNERLDDVDALISDVVDTVNDNATTVSAAVGDGAGNISEYLSGNTQSINDTLKDVTGAVGYDMTQEMKTIWSSVDGTKGVVSTYGDGFSSQLTTINSVLDKIEANTAAMAAKSNEEAQTVVETTTPTTTPVTPSTPTKTETPKTGDTTKTTTPTVPTLDDATKHGVAAAIWNGGYGWGTGSTRANRLTEVFGANNGIQAIVNTRADINGNPRGYSYTEMRKKFKGYKTGGIVDYTGLAQLDGTPGKPELVLNAEDTKNFLALRDTLRVLSQQEFGIGSPKYNVGNTGLSGLTDISGILASLSKPFFESNSTGGDVKIEINIDHVQDYNDFVTQLQKDKQFEKMVRAMSTDQLFGASPLAKNKYRWNNK